MSFTFFSNSEYKQAAERYPQDWTELLAGQAKAPAQYRLGVMFVASFMNRASHGYLAIRYCLTLLDFFFFVVALAATFGLLEGANSYRAASSHVRAVILCLALLLLLYYLPWTFWYHKPETIANLASLSVAGLLLSGRTKIPWPLAALGLIAISAYLGTIRADAGLSLNLGILIVAASPRGLGLGLGKIGPVMVAIAGIAADIGTEFYIKHFLYPANPFSDPLLQLFNNLKSPFNLFCFFVALAPFLLFIVLARRVWGGFEAWERVLLTASLFEMAMFLVVAKVDEVRLFLPFPMALVPTAAVLFYRCLLGEPSITDPVEQESFAV